MVALSWLIKGIVESDHITIYTIVCTKMSVHKVPFHIEHGKKI